MDQKNETTNQDETIKVLDHQHTNKLKQIYDEFNNESIKYIAVNHLQNQSLKQITELGFNDNNE